MKKFSDVELEAKTRSKMDEFADFDFVLGGLRGVFSKPFFVTWIVGKDGFRLVEIKQVDDKGLLTIPFRK